MLEAKNKPKYRFQVQFLVDIPLRRGFGIGPGIVCDVVGGAIFLVGRYLTQYSMIDQSGSM